MAFAGAFQPNAFQGDAFQFGTLLFRIRVELAGVGGGWTDITSDVRTGHSCRYGIMGGGPEDRVAEPGELRFRLDNSTRNSGGLTGYYSPYHANVRAGWAIGIRCEWALNLDSSGWQVQFIGWLDEINVAPGELGAREVSCVAVDWLDWAARWTVSGVATQLNATADDCITALVNAAPVQPESESLDVGSDTYPYALDTAGGESLLAELQRLAMSEAGLIYVKAGILYFENRFSRLTAGPTLTLTDQVAGADEENWVRIEIEGGRDAVRNRVRVVVSPRTIDGSNVVLFTLNDTPQLAAGESITIEAPYSDPSQLAARVGGTSMVTPVATTDYTAHQNADGTGTSYTASLTVTPTFGGSSASLVVTNTHGTDSCYVTHLQLRGLGLYAFEEVEVVVVDQSSIDDYGELELAFEMPYQSSIPLAQSVAEHLLGAWKTPGNGQVSVTFLASTQGLREAILSHDIGAAISVHETMTGLNSAFWINGREIHLGTNNLASVTLFLGRAETQVYWELDVSELDTETVLAPG